MYLQHVVVGHGEHGLQHTFERLGDPGNFDSGSILDPEVPRSPVLCPQATDDHSPRFDVETNLADCVLLHDLTDVLTRRIANDDARLDELGWARDAQDDSPARVDELERVGEVLIPVAEEPEKLLESVLTNLAYGTDLVAGSVMKDELGVDLDQFDLLVHHHEQVVEERTRDGTPEVRSEFSASTRNRTIM